MAAEPEPAERGAQGRALTGGERQGIAQKLVTAISHGARMTRDNALAWLRGRLPHRASHPLDGESLLDGLLLARLDLGPDGVLVVRPPDPGDPANDLEPEEGIEALGAKPEPEPDGIEHPDSDAEVP